MDNCFTCKEYLDCSIRMGCNLVGCVGYKSVDNLNGEINKDNINIIDKGICSDCVNINICDLQMRNECLKPSKYIEYYRALKYERRNNDKTIL